MKTPEGRAELKNAAEERDAGRHTPRPPPERVRKSLPKASKKLAKKVRKQAGKLLDKVEKDTTISSGQEIEEEEENGGQAEKDGEELEEWAQGMVEELQAAIAAESQQ